MRSLLSLIVLACGVAATQAHFVFVVPQKDGKSVQVVFSDALGPDKVVPITKIAGTKLSVRGATGKATELSLKKGEGAYTASLTGTGSRVVHGLTDYGVLQRGSEKPYLLRYHPKAIVGPIPADGFKLGEAVELEIVPSVAKGKLRFQVLAKGKAVGQAEVNVLLPGGGKKLLKTGVNGTTEAIQAAGQIGAWVRHAVKASGKHGGKDYDEARHYATLVVDLPAAGTATSVGLPDLPVGVSSLGAAVSDGYLYVYGGHSGRVHEYSTETTLGAFRRLQLDGGTKWEDLPGGAKAQGIALVAHQGKLYRIGGMQPRNKPDEKGDSISLRDVACYDPAAKKWQAMPELPEGRSSHDAVVVGDKIVVVGGWRLVGGGKRPIWHKTALVLDLAQKEPKWQSVDQPFQRRALTAAAHQGKVHVIAGLTSAGGLVLAVDIYDPKTGKWTKGKDIPGPQRHGFTPAACVADDRLYLSPADGNVYQLNDAGTTWDKVGALKQARAAHRLVPGGKGRLVAVGGSSGVKAVAQTEVVAAGCPIRPVLEEQVAAWNEGDLKRFLATYWDSEELTFYSGGTISKGHQAVAARYRKNYQSEGKEMGKLSFSGLEVEMLGKDAALARARWKVVTSKETMSGLFTLVLKKLPEGWKITHDHTSREVPAKKK